MNVKVISCSECGAPLRVMAGQAMTLCSFCDVKYYVKQGTPPAITVRDNLDLGDAKRTVLNGLKRSDVSKGFLSNSFFEKGTLFFIPFIEIRGIKTRETDQVLTGKNSFAYIAYDYIEHGSNLSDLDIDFIDSQILETALLEAEQVEFNIREMRRRGVVLPLKESFSSDEKSEGAEFDVVEKHVRIIYFPVWEINYSYSGIIFKSYISAVDGTPVKIQAIRDHRRKLLLSILGVFSLAILFARGIKFSLFFLASASLGINQGRTMFFLSLGGALLTLLVSSLLIPYFWEMFAFREIISIRRDGTESRLINYTENNLIRFLRSVLGRIQFIFSVKDSDDG
jgi:hypothetical protein